MSRVRHLKIEKFDRIKEKKAVANDKSNVDEMGYIKEAFANIGAEWPIPKAIENDPLSFSQEIKELFTALIRHIQKEKAELYPVVGGYNF